VKPRVLNFVGGPDTGKSTMATAVFSELKFRRVRSEYVPEYAKWLAWEGRTGKVFADQGYIFAKQSFHLMRVAQEVAITVTDACLLNTLVYTPDYYPMGRELKELAVKTYEQYDNLNILILREGKKDYQKEGRFQDEDEAIRLDSKIASLFYGIKGTEVHVMKWGRDTVDKTIEIMQTKQWL
jgi:nicotinamide riboside kinase